MQHGCGIFVAVFVHETHYARGFEIARQRSRGSQTPRIVEGRGEKELRQGAAGEREVRVALSPIPQPLRVPRWWWCRPSARRPAPPGGVRPSPLSPPPGWRQPGRQAVPRRRARPAGPAGPARRARVSLSERAGRSERTAAAPRLASSSSSTPTAPRPRTARFELTPASGTREWLGRVTAVTLSRVSWQ